MISQIGLSNVSCPETKFSSGEGLQLNKSLSIWSKATGNGEKFSNHLWRFRPQNRRKQQNLLWVCKELKPSGQQQAHAGTSTRICSGDSYVQTTAGSKQACQTILGSWKNGKEEKSRRKKQQYFFFYLLESKIIFTENAVCYYNLEKRLS